jgi:hypothetical protein
VLKLAQSKTGSLLSSDIPSVESKNHNKTRFILNKAILSEKVSVLVRSFIEDTRDINYASNCAVTRSATG